MQSRREQQPLVDEGGTRCFTIGCGFDYESLDLRSGFDSVDSGSGSEVLDSSSSSSIALSSNCGNSGMS